MVRDVDAEVAGPPPLISTLTQLVIGAVPRGVAFVASAAGTEYRVDQTSIAPGDLAAEDTQQLPETFRLDVTGQELSAPWLMTSFSAAPDLRPELAEWQVLLCPIPPDATEPIGVFGLVLPAKSRGIVTARKQLSLAADLLATHLTLVTPPAIASEAAPAPREIKPATADLVPTRGQPAAIVGQSSPVRVESEVLRTHQSSQRLAALVEWSNDAIVGIDADLRISHWNLAAQRMFQYTAAEIVGELYTVLVPEGAAMVLWADLIARSATPFGGTIETERRRKDGSIIEVELRAALIRDEDGAPAGISVILREIGERRATLRSLQQLELRYRSFVDQMPAITYISGTNSTLASGPILHLGGRIETHTGYAIENWLDDPLFTFTLMPPDDRERVRRIDQRSDESGEPYFAEYRLISPRGDVEWYRDEAVLIRDEHQAPQYWLGFMLNISAQKRAEAEISAANADLRLVNTELERLSAVKSEIISMISHEFRTPLTSIQGYSELLMNEPLDGSDISAFAGTINANARRLARMIHDMLDLDRLDTGRTVARADLVDVNEIAEAVHDAMRAATKAHRFVLRLDPDLPLITGDTDLLTQVLTNLVANAIKYAPGGGDIIVTTSQTADTVTLAVTDQGMGIPPADLERIFDRYARLDRPEQRGIEGNGLGLPIARHIVDLHDGRLWAESDAATPGATFCVELPKRRP